MKARQEQRFDVPYNFYIIFVQIFEEQMKMNKNMNETFNGKELIEFTLNVGIAEDGRVYLYSKRDNNRIVADLHGVQNAITVIRDYSPIAAEYLQLKSQDEKTSID